MKAVILAAGLSSRIRRVTNGTPKCLLRFGDQAILDFQLDSLFSAGVEETSIVVGYGKEHLMEHVFDRHPEKYGRIRFIENRYFAITNNLYSLWLAKNWVGEDDFLCLNADVLFHPAIIPPAVMTSAPISIIVDPEFREETMKVVIRNGRVLTIRKGISRAEASGTYIGITRFSRRVSKPLFESIGALVREGRVNDFFQAAVERLMAEGTPVSYTTTGGLPWTEVDDEADLNYAREQVYPRLAAQLGLLKPPLTVNDTPAYEACKSYACQLV